MGSSGSQPELLQKWRPRPNVLISSLVNVEASDPFSTYFRVPIPDSRLRVKITIAFAFKAGQQPSSQFPAVNLGAGGATLWMYEAEDDDSGATGTTFPATNIEGTEAARTLIPQAVGLSAYSREFITAADNIEGIFTTAFNSYLGNWMLQLRYQPDNGQRFSREEWEEIRNLCKPVVPPPVIIV